MQLLIVLFMIVTCVYNVIHRIRSARIKNILDNCLATNKIRQITPKVDLRKEVELYVDTYAGFPEHSMRTGEYFFPLRPDPFDAPEPDAALADFRNVDHSETWGVPNSTKKSASLFRTPLGAHFDKRILCARRSIKKAVAVANAAKACNVKPTSFVAVRKRASFAKREQADAIFPKVQWKGYELIWDCSDDEMRGTIVLLFIFDYFLHYCVV